MEFHLEDNDTYRLGKLTNNEFSLKTPACFLYTKLGSVPYLSKDVLERAGLIPSFLNMPLDLFTDHRETVALFSGGLQNFTSMQECSLYSSVHDPATPLSCGFNRASQVALWNKGGKALMNAKSYMEMVEECKPGWFEALYDGDVGGGGGSVKRTRKGVDCSISMLDECLKRREESEILQKSKVVGVVVGGLNEEERLRSARETACRPVDGFSIQSFHNFGAPSSQVNTRLLEPLLLKVLALLPPRKLRVMHGCLPPLTILHLSCLGVDLFDNSYCYLLTECMAALNLDIITKTNNNIPAKKMRLEQGQGDGDGDCKEATDATSDIDSNVIFLSHKSYHDDMRPLLIGCSCLTCSQHSRAYIHHLVQTHELLASILLCIHNIHHYKHFMAVLRESMKRGGMCELKGRLEARQTPDLSEVLSNKEKKKTGFNKMGAVIKDDQACWI